jgi:peptidoglycan/xylan/chitin deacetylase (PgdA/CDA1 family)
MHSERVDFKCIVVTSWDDGHISDKRLAILLERYGIRGTFYVPVFNRGVVCKPGLDDSDLVSLSRQFEIGSHTLNHYLLPSLSYPEAKREILDSRLRLGEIIEKEVRSFSYPLGAFSEDVVRFVQEAGYTNSRTTDPFNVTRDDMLRCGVFKVGCTVHAKNKPIITKKAFIKEAFLRKHPYVLALLGKFHSWDLLAKALFDKAYANDGVFHLWGHSWEIEKNSDWDRLETVLSHIGARSDVKYLTVSEFVEESNDVFGDK